MRYIIVLVLISIWGCKDQQQEIVKHDVDLTGKYAVWAYLENGTQKFGPSEIFVQKLKYTGGKHQNSAWAFSFYEHRFHDWVQPNQAPFVYFLGYDIIPVTNASVQVTIADRVFSFEHQKNGRFTCSNLVGNFGSADSALLQLIIDQDTLISKSPIMVPPAIQIQDSSEVIALKRTNPNDSTKYEEGVDRENVKNHVPVQHDPRTVLFMHQFSSQNEWRRQAGDDSTMRFMFDWTSKFHRLAGDVIATHLGSPYLKNYPYLNGIIKPYWRIWDEPKYTYYTTWSRLLCFSESGSINLLPISFFWMTIYSEAKGKDLWFEWVEKRGVDLSVHGKTSILPDNTNIYSLKDGKPVKDRNNKAVGAFEIFGASYHKLTFKVVRPWEQTTTAAQVHKPVITD
jgi:hypothetical protein